MASPSVPSAKLLRAAQGEIERIERASAIAEQRRATLLAELQELEQTIEGYARRRGLLDELISGQTSPASPASATAPSLEPAAAESWTPRRALRGRELRRVAARLLWRSERDSEIHYRDWFERVMTAGFAVGGKDPAASFLTNIRDSPAVTRGSRSGYYRLEPHNLDKLEEQISETQAELADLNQSLTHAHARSTDPVQIDRLTTHQDHLTQLLRRTGAEVEELKYIFSEDQAADPTSPAPAQLAA